MEFLAIPIITFSIDEVTDADRFSFHFRVLGDSITTKEFSVFFIFFENIFAN